MKELTLKEIQNLLGYEVKIVADKPIRGKTLGSVKPGDTVTIGEHEYIVLGHEKGITAVVAKKPTKFMAFGKDSNYAKSDIRAYCNGVTVQEWISVDDRLPIEEAKAHEQEWPGEYCEFLVMIEKGSLPTTLYYNLEENEWFRINTALERETYEVTHWMPLPLPPKGE